MRSRQNHGKPLSSIKGISKFFWMENPFKSGDKVLTKIKGQQVEAVVNQIYNQEVQVRTAEKKLLWRTVKTVTLVEATVIPPVEGIAKPEASAPATPPPLPQANAGAVSPADEAEKPKEPEASNLLPTPANMDGADAEATPPLPAVAHSETNEEALKGGPALAPASEPASNSVKYKRTRSLWPKRKKI